MKAYREGEVKFHSFLTSALEREREREEWLNSRTGRFTPGRVPDIHRRRSWVGPVRRFECFSGDIFFLHYRESNFVPSIP